MTLDEIELAVGCNEMTRHQVFTKMKCLLEKQLSILNEADRRAGFSERKAAHVNDSLLKRERWMSKAKHEAGYADDVSFDVVWADMMDKKRSLTIQYED